MYTLRRLAAVLLLAVSLVVEAGVALGSVGGVTVHAATREATATEVTYAVGFTATSAIPAWVQGGPNPPPVGGGFVQLAAPTGSQFSSNSFSYRVTDGSRSSDALDVMVGPGGLGSNVVDIYAHFSINPGDVVKIAAYGVENPTVSDAAGTFSVSTSSDPVSTQVPVPITAVSSTIEKAGCTVRVTKLRLVRLHGGRLTVLEELARPSVTRRIARLG